MMLENAREHGVDAHEQVRVRDVIMEGDRVVGVNCSMPKGNRTRFVPRWLLMPSGPKWIADEQVQAPRVGPCAEQRRAVWTYWENAYRDTGKDEGATVVLQLDNKLGWFWYIPLHDNRVSIGVVAPFDYIFKGRGDHENDLQRRAGTLPSG